MGTGSWAWTGWGGSRGGPVKRAWPTRQEPTMLSNQGAAAGYVRARLCNDLKQRPTTGPWLSPQRQTWQKSEQTSPLSIFLALSFSSMPQGRVMLPPPSPGSLYPTHWHCFKHLGSGCWLFRTTAYPFYFFYVVFLHTRLPGPIIVDLRNCCCAWIRGHHHHDRARRAQFYEKPTVFAGITDSW